MAEGRSHPENSNQYVRRPEFYNMDYKYRGKAIIFSHEYFDTKGLDPRPGTRVDSQNLEKCLKNLGFTVDVHCDLKYAKIMKHIKKTSKKKHSNNDCLLIVVLTHGSSGMLHARDKRYRSEELWCRFTAEKCPSLAGKPKLFFLQACQGGEYDDGVTLIQGNIEYYDRFSQTCDNSEKDGWFEPHKHPTQADFLLALSTVPGYYAWRNTARGSWFIQALCEELSYWGTELDLLTLLTLVSQKVALNFESNTDYIESSEKKQVPCISSMLTRRLVFTKKPESSGRTSIFKQCFM